ncbi:MAG: DUF1624 domain-containing protein [Candidatus Heimdallarchaeota archaeon]|nr:MAG: DUF1624 domain-containing protein [Candidatus Heimdallarchaeota archaeon]
MKSSSTSDEFLSKIRIIMPTQRILAIDFVRGVVMVLMALDHASIFWNAKYVANEGLQGYRPIFPDIFQFFSRFVTHYCAPTFIFLAGLSITLAELKRLQKGTNQKDITQYFITRGLILIVIEWSLIAFIFRAAPLYFGVLACIGVGFIIFAFVRRIPAFTLLILSLGVILMSPFSELSFNTTPGNFLFYIEVFLKNPSWPYGLYPLDPWLGVMGLGYVTGYWVHQQQQLPDACKRITKRLTIIGSACIGTFFILRIGTGWPWNYLGIWDVEESFTIENFFLLAKYPPSIVFLLWTLGGMALILALTFSLQKKPWFQKWSIPIVFFGTTPLFFYCAHLCFYGTTFVFTFLFLYGTIPNAPGIESDLSLLITIIVWIIGVIILFPLCLMFQRIKKKSPHSLLKYI